VFAWPWRRKNSTGPRSVRPRQSRGQSADARLDGPARGGRPIDLDTLVSQNIGPIVLGLAAVVLVLLVALAIVVRRTTRLGGRLESLTQGSDAQSLEAVLGSHLERVRKVVADVDRIEARTAVVERDLLGSFGRVGLVRFNPFEDTGGNQSFALAMLDGRGDGFVVSSLHARSGTRVYAKAIAKGTSEAALSAEEAEALRIAVAKPAPGAAA
jgi:hypothetical protein